jgi:2,5-diketo-D-gluconate reductase B
MHIVPANGANIPALGFGTFRMTEDEVLSILPAALAAGFRHVDTAQVYKNEAAVGEALEESGAPRSEVFLTTKVWVSNFAHDAFLASVEDSLRKLRTDYVDLLLLHWPGGSDVPHAEQIESLNEVQRRGWTRHVGVSNYNVAQMADAIRQSPAKIVTNQIEYHPWLDQSKLLAAARAAGVSVTAYYAMADGKSARDPVLAEIGRAHGKSAAQVALRWLVQQPDVVALSKTAKVSRLGENLAVFDFELSEEEMARVFALAQDDGRIVSPKELAPAWD